MDVATGSRSNARSRCALAPRHARGLAGRVDPPGRRTLRPRLPHGGRPPVGPRLHRDLRQGDRFEILYRRGPARRRVPLGGHHLRPGVNDSRGRRHEAYRYGDSGAYYDGEGRPLKKMFLRSPLRYSRDHLAFQPPAVPPGAQIVPAALGRRLRRAGGHAGPGDRQRHGDLHGLGPGRRQRGEGPAPGRLRDRLPAPVALRQGASVRARACGKGTSSPTPAPRAWPAAPTSTTGCKLSERWIDPLSLKSVRDEPIPS